MDLGRYIETLCKEVDASVAHSKVETDVELGIVVQTDHAISAALIVNELITNATKYAYGEKSGCTIWVKVARSGADRLTISVRDKGKGLPPGFDSRSAKGLGMRIVTSLAKQVHGEVAFRAKNPGTEFTLTFPL